MHISLNQIISVLEENSINYNINGGNIHIHELSAIDSCVRNSLCYYVGDNPNELSGIENSIIICKNTLTAYKSSTNTIIYTDNPQLSFYLSSKLFEIKPTLKIDERTVLNNSAHIGKNVSIGPFCHIENCTIGDEVVIESGVRICNGCMIGDRVHIQSNTVIGASGVMWTWSENNKKVPCVQTGIVVIENDVTIGSNITIVKGAFKNKNTIIGKGTMIAHGTMIGHGVNIGPNNHFANNVSMAGSVKTGANCFFGSGAVIRPQIKLADDTIIGAGAVVVSNFDTVSGLVIAGNPAKVLNSKKKSYSGIPDRGSLK